MLEADPLDVLVGADGDAVIDADGLHLVSGLAGVAQLCRIAIQLFLGEWFLNLAVGMPWFQEILGQKFDAQLIRTRITERLLQVPGVIEVLTVLPRLDSTTRKVTVEWQVRTVFGDTEPDTLAVGGSSG